MGTRKTYALFTINQDNKIDEIYDCGKFKFYFERCTLRECQT